MAKLKLSVVLDVPNAEDIAEIKKLEHHVEYLLNLKEYPEIASVSEVTITNMEGDGEHDK